MSDTPRSFDKLVPKSKAPQVAWEYADHVWLETLFKQRQELLGDAISRVVATMKDEIGDKAYGESAITDGEIAEYKAWKTDIKREQAGWDSRLSVLGQKRTQNEAAYRQYITDEGFDGLEPAFIIDPTEPEWRLTIQREFAVEREARMISANELRSRRIKRFTDYKATPKGRYYAGRMLAGASLNAECCAITAYLHKKYGKSVDEYEAAYQDKQWLPEVITRWVKYKRQNGRHDSDEDWWKVQKEMGYWMPEIVQLSIKTGQNVEEVKFYEGEAVDRKPRRLVRPDPLMRLDIDGKEVFEDDSGDEERERDGNSVEEKSELADEGEVEDETRADDENQEEGRNLGLDGHISDNEDNDAPQLSDEYALPSKQAGIWEDENSGQATSATYGASKEDHEVLEARTSLTKNGSSSIHDLGSNGNPMSGSIESPGKQMKRVL